MDTPVVLEPPSRRRAGEFLARVQESRRFHRGWVAPPDSVDAFSTYLKNVRGPSSRGFFLCLQESSALAGVVNVSQIARGNFQSAYLGFYLFQPFAGQGYMTAGLRLVLRVVFSEMKLHRVEANIQPDNPRSIALVKHLGFRLEGYSPRYLKVGGRWRDHERWTMLVDAWRSGRRMTAKGE